MIRLYSLIPEKHTCKASQSDNRKHLDWEGNLENIVFYLILCIKLLSRPESSTKTSMKCMALFKLQTEFWLTYLAKKRLLFSPISNCIPALLLKIHGKLIRKILCSNNTRLSLFENINVSAGSELVARYMFQQIRKEKNVHVSK